MNRSWGNETPPDIESNSRPLKLVWLPMWVLEQETQGGSNETERERMGIHFLYFLHHLSWLVVFCLLSNFVSYIWCCSLWLHSCHKSLLDFFFNILDSKFYLEMEMHNPTDILIAVDKELETERSNLMKSLNLIFVAVSITGIFFQQQVYSISVGCSSDISKAFLAILNSFDGEQTHKISFFKYFYAMLISLELPPSRVFKWQILAIQWEPNSMSPKSIWCWYDCSS